MPKNQFPWPAGTYGTPYWRDRHTITGDSIPPTAPAGPAGGAYRVPYEENVPAKGRYDGAYAVESRLIGIGEDPESAVINRALYEMTAKTDALFEKDDACLDILSQLAVATGGAAPPYEIDLLTWTSYPVVYLGPAGTTAVTGGANPELWCSNYIKLWATGALAPLYSPTTGLQLYVDDVYAAAGGISLYTALPTLLQTYPYGTPGVINAFPAANQIDFTGPGAGTLPTGTPAGPGPIGVAFFNYSVYQRVLRDAGNLLTGVPPDLTDAFAISTNRAAVGPDVFTLNRNVNPAGAAPAVGTAWAAGDIVYTTHFAFAPTLGMSEVMGATDVELIHGTIATQGVARSERFMDFLRFADRDAPLGLPIVSVEPPTATMYSFDYANALFRATDNTPRGTIGFDFEGQELDPIADKAPYAGMIHRKALDIQSGDTIIAIGNTATLNPLGAGGDIVQLGGGSTFYGAAVNNTAVIPGVDLLYIEDSGTGLPIGLYIIDAMGAIATEATVVDLDGAAPAFVMDTNATVTLYRPQFRTGGWKLGPNSQIVPAVLQRGNLLVGDVYSTQLTPALTTIAAYDPTAVDGCDLFQGWSGDLARDAAVGSVGTTYQRYRLLWNGSAHFGGEEDPGLPLGTPAGPRRTFGRMAAAYSSVPGGLAPYGAFLGAASNSLAETIAFGSIDYDNATPWEEASAYLHMIDDQVGAATATYWQLGTGLGSAFDATSGLGTGDHGGVLVGLPGINGGPLPNPLNVLMDATADRDAGYWMAWCDAAGDMEVAEGFTTAGGFYRGYAIRETPYTVAPWPATSPPTHIFTVSPARLELVTDTSIGWEAPVSFYHQIPMQDGDTYTTEAWLLQNQSIGAVGYLARPVWRLDANKANQHVAFPINLPENSVIEDVTVYFVGKNAAANTQIVSMYLAQHTWNSLLIGAEATDALGGVPINIAAGLSLPQIITAVNVGQPVKNSDYAYSLVVECTTDLNDEVEIVSARVKYKVLDLLPA